MERVVVEENPRFNQFALGTAQWGMPYGIANESGVPDRDEIAEMLRVAKRAGIDTLDTARGYQDSEFVIGELTEGDDHWRIVTKLDASIGAPDLGVERALAQTEESLALSREALRRDTLDVLLLHRAAHRTAYDGAIWQRLCEKRAAGEVLSLGVSVGSPDEAWALLEDPSIEVLQVASNLLDQRLVSAGFFERCRELGKRVFVRSVFLQGVGHLGPDRLPPNLQGLGDALKRLEGWVFARDLKLADAFLGYARDIIGPVAVLGCESTGQLCENLMKWRSLEIDRQSLLEVADEVGDLDEQFLNPARWTDSPSPAP